MHCLSPLMGSVRIFFKFAIVGIVISITMLTGCIDQNKYVSYDFDAYLSCDTDFKKDASMVLPSKRQLEDSKILYYAIYDYNNVLVNIGLAFQESMLCLTAEYSDEQFADEIQRLEEMHNNEDGPLGGKFYYNGTLYDSFQYTGKSNTYCALAYHICSHSNTVSYIILSCSDLAYMNVENTLRFFSHPQMDQIMPYNIEQK